MVSLLVPAAWGTYMGSTTGSTLAVTGIAFFAVV